MDEWSLKAPVDTSQDLDKTFKAQTLEDSPKIAHTGLVIIGRNEGERLKACLLSIPQGLPAVYVDSGSTDGSVEFAKSQNVIVVELPTHIGFTAARARNAGFKALQKTWPDLTYVQMVDGDCILQPLWIEQAAARLTQDAGLAVVFGRRRERFPEASHYNAMCDAEWNVPIGPARSCGGDALFRVTALIEADGYTDDLIAGEEPDLCLRLGQAGWRVERVDAEMTLHDANILVFSAWRSRARRAGHAFMEHVWRHKERANPDWKRQVRSIFFWGLGLPFAAAIFIILCLITCDAAFLFGTAAIAVIYPIQWLRITLRQRKEGADIGFSMNYAALIIIGKFVELHGAFQFLTSKWLRHKPVIIEYKQLDA